MKSKNRTVKRTIAFTFAFLFALSGAGIINNPIGVSETSMLTASAATQITNQNLGIETPADKVMLYHGNIVVGEYTWEIFTSGISFSSASNTYLVLEYPDGNLKYDANTLELLENTRESGISREFFCIPYDSLSYGYSDLGVKFRMFYVFSTERDAVTGNVGKILTEKTNTLEKLNFYGDAGYRLNEGETAVFDYKEGTDIYIVERISKNDGRYELSKYNPVLNQKEGTALIAGGGYMNTTTFNPADFNVPDGYISINVTGEGLINANENLGFMDDTFYKYWDALEKGTVEIGSAEYLKAQFKSISYLPEEWLTGGCKVVYSGNNSVSNNSYSLNNFLRVTFNYPNGGTIDYTYFCDTPYMNSYNLAAPLQNSDGEPETGNTNEPIYNGKTDNGEPLVNDEVLGTEIQEGDYNVTLYKGAEPYDTLTGAEFEKGNYIISNYNPDDNYYAKVDYDDNSGDYVMYRFNDGLGAWEKRIDTKETPEYVLPLTIGEFPDEFAGGYEKFDGETADSWSSADFAGGEKTAPIHTKESDKYGFTFNYPQGSANYVLIGIDPELVSTTGTKTYTPVPVDMNANAGDAIHVEGQTEDGTPVAFDVTVKKGKEDEPIKLPDGDYKVSDETTGLFDEVTADSDNDKETAGSVGSDGKYNSDGEDGEKQGDKATLNLTEPESTSQFAITTPDGKPIDSGKLRDGVLDNITDINVPEDKITATPYVKYETVIGETNSTDPDKLVKENGYIIDVDIDGELIKLIPEHDILGDVNLDGKVNVKDIIMLQKYLLNVQSFHIENFINADMNRDGDVDVIDLALLKRFLLNNQ